jgi:hypothetical protein
MNFLSSPSCRGSRSLRRSGSDASTHPSSLSLSLSLVLTPPCPLPVARLPQSRSIADDGSARAAMCATSFPRDDVHESVSGPRVDAEALAEGKSKVAGARSTCACLCLCGAGTGRDGKERERESLACARRPFSRAGSAIPSPDGLQFRTDCLHANPSPRLRAPPLLGPVAEPPRPSPAAAAPVAHDAPRAFRLGRGRLRGHSR